MTRDQYLEKARELRTAAKSEEGWEAVQLIAEATRYETFADMMRDKNHGMWRCIEIEKARIAAKAPDKTPTTRPPFRWDTTLGYKGRVCNNQIHAGTQRYARLTFK